MAGSLGSILSIARSALLSSQKAVEVTSHNIANASTPGYSRQRALLATGPSVVLPEGSFGTGVRVLDVERLRSTLLDVNFREQSALHSGFEQRFQTLSEVEEVLAEPSDSGLASALDAFWGAWGDLANNPSDSNVRIALRDRSTALANAFHRIEAGITRAETTTFQRLNGLVDDVNTITGQIASINAEIVAAEAAGQTAGDLRDQRDHLTDQLSELLPVHVVERPDGGTGVYAAGLAIVDGGFSKPLSVTSGANYGIATGTGAPISAAGSGSIGAALDLLNVDLPGYQQQLDDLAAGMVSAVNTLHQTGTNASGTTAVDFFDPTGVTARTIDISAAVAGDAQAIAAGTADGSGLYQAGENDVALAMGQLRDAPQAVMGGVSFGTHYGNLVTDVGADVSSAGSSLQAHETIRSQADIRRLSISGVSVEEEMVNLLRFQQAFSAAARLVTTADEMMQTVVSMV